MRLSIFADYHQIQIFDQQADAGALAEAWDPCAVADRLAVADGCLALATLRNVTVTLTVHTPERQPTLDVAAVDHAVEADIVCPSGALLIVGPTDSGPAGRVRAHPGRWRCRYTIAGAATVSTDGVSGEERYTLILWPTPTAQPLAVLKRLPVG
jgi:hypothetical protein